MLAVNPEIAPVQAEIWVLRGYNRLKRHCSSVTVCCRLRLPVFHWISPDLTDVAMAEFTLTSTLKSNDLGAKIQRTGATSGLIRMLSRVAVKEGMGEVGGFGLVHGLIGIVQQDFEIAAVAANKAYADAGAHRHFAVSIH